MTQVLEDTLVVTFGPRVETPSPVRRPPRSFGFRPELEGLRGIAVLAVVLYHAGVPFVPGGYVGVDVFFVLSGYLITGLMLAEIGCTGRLSLSRFYARRVRRLLPASTLVLTVTALASMVLLPIVQRARNAEDVLSAALYVSNWRFAAQSTDYQAADAAPSVVLHFWSLGIEEQFYVLWPLVIVAALVLLRRVALRRDAVLGSAIAAIAVGSFVAGAVMTSTDQPLAFFGTFTRIWELAVGAIVAVVGARVLALAHVERAVLGWMGAALIAWAVLTFDASTTYPGLAALAPVLGSALVIAGCTAHDDRLGPGPALALSNRRLRRAGQVSYSWYLWHWPVLVLPAAALGHALSWWQAALAVVGSYLLAALTYRYVESTLRYARRLQATGIAMRFGVALTLTAVVASVLLWRSADDSANATGVVDGTVEVAPDTFAAAPGVTVDLGTGAVSTPARLTPSVTEAPDDVFARLYDNGCQAGQTDTRLVSCVMGKKKSHLTMAVVGDSHASAWAPALDILAVERKWRMVTMTKAGCAVAAFPVWNPQLKRFTPECDEWRAALLQRLEKLRPDLVVVANRWTYQVPDAQGNSMPDAQAAPIVADGTRTMLESLRATGAEVVYLRDIPAPGFDVPTCVAEHESDYAACDFSRADRMNQDSRLLDAARSVPGVQVVDIVDSVCADSAATCPVVAQNIIRYRDDSHVTATYARTLVPQLMSAFPARLRT